MKFKRNISTSGMLFAGIGSVIGSGWLFGPLYAAQVAGPAAAVSWVIGGLLMIVIALTFAELGTTYPVAGGMIQFAQQSYGPLLSFIIGWMVWISSLAVAPVETMGVILYAANYIPSLVTTVDHSRVLTSTGILAAGLVMGLMCILNYYGARFFSKTNSVITIIKLIVPITTIMLLVTSAHFNWDNFSNQTAGGFAPYGLHGVLAALPLGGVIYSFIGANTILQLAGESNNPQKSIPIALIGSMLFCIIMYAGLQIAFVGAISPSAFANGWHALNYVGDNGPFAGIMVEIGLAWFVLVIYADALISPFGTGYIFTASTARVSYGLSQIGFLPKALMKITKNGVPTRSILLNYCLGLLLFLPFPGWQKLASFIISCFIISYIVGPIALIALRKKHPNISRPFKLPYSYAISLIAFYICNLLIFWTGWDTVSIMMLILLVGLCFFFLYCYRNEDVLLRQQLKNCWWLFPYLGGMTILSYLGSFGHGKDILPFGWDFLVIAIYTVGIFDCARRSVRE